MQDIRYKSLNKEHLSSKSLDKIYLEIKHNINILLAIYNMINIVSNKSNNQTEDKILNKTILTKNHEFFHPFSESAGIMKLTIYGIAT